MPESREQFLTLVAKLEEFLLFPLSGVLAITGEEGWQDGVFTDQGQDLSHSLLYFDTARLESFGTVYASHLKDIDTCSVDMYHTYIHGTR